MHRKDVAGQIGVDKTSVFNWEANNSRPDLRLMPAVIRFLGYNPLPEANTVAELLVRHRAALGMTQKDAASQIGVDPGTLAVGARGKGANRCLPEPSETLFRSRGGIELTSCRVSPRFADAPRIG